jgi:hypothetical protein
MSFQTLFLAAVIAAFGALFVTLMYAWISTNLHQMKRTPAAVESTPARRPDPSELNRAA